MSKSYVNANQSYKEQNKKVRNLGNNYPLAFKTPNGTHMTLIYFNNVKRGYEQERVNSLARAFMDEIKFPTVVKLELGEMIEPEERCVAIKNAQLIVLQKQLYDYFENEGFDLRPLRNLHIDLRGLDLIETLKNTMLNTRIFQFEDLPEVAEVVDVIIGI